MANTFLNTGTGIATSNPQSNVEQVQNTMPNQPQTTNTNSSQISPITIPIQIQPQIGQNPVTNQPNIDLQVGNQNNTASAPTPQTYQPNNTNTNVVDFNQIYSGYQSQYGTYNTNNNAFTSGIKKTSIGTTIVTPTTGNLNSVQGQYQSAFADTINGLISEMLNQMNNGFSYDPSTDNSLRVASEYAANTTLQSLAGSGVLNSSATAERVARIVSELIPQYEEKAHNRWIEYLGQLADTAQLVMNYDNQQFQYWADAKDREFKEREFEFEKQQKALDNAWKRIDELGYADNEASTILGIPVGTLSKDAREAKEQREYELQKMREQYQLEYQNNVAIAQIKSQLELNNSKAMADYNSRLEKELYSYKSNIDTAKSKELANYNSNLEKNLYSYKSTIDTAKSKELESYQNSLSNSSKEYEYQLAEKYGNTSNSSKSSTSLNTYKDIINNRWVEYDDFSHKYSVTDNTGLYNFLVQEYAAGRMSESDFTNLVALYGVTTPTNNSTKSTSRASGGIKFSGRG